MELLKIQARCLARVSYESSGSLKGRESRKLPEDSCRKILGVLREDSYESDRKNSARNSHKKAAKKPTKSGTSTAPKLG